MRPLGQLVFSLALATLARGGACAQDPVSPTVEELLAGHLEARGGVERLREVRSLRLEGTYGVNSEYTPMVALRRRPDLYRFDRHAPEGTLTVAYDGREAWWTDPAADLEASALAGAAAENIVAEADFDGPLIEPSGKGHRIELLGRERTDTGEAYGLRIELARGATETWYLDVESLLAVERVSSWWQYGREWELRTYFSDYRSVEGVMVPFLIESEFSSIYRMLRIKSVEVDPELAPAEFARPAAGGG
jgi:hypothetical protein